MHAMAGTDYLVVGAGFSGVVLARELAERLDKRILVIEQRDHLAGNCHTSRDEGTGVMVHCYGPHIFNTNDEQVWKYVNRFGKFGLYLNRVKASTSRGIFSLPINLHTINQFFGKRFSPAEARAFIAERGDHRISEPQNFEEQALKFLGRELYEAFFYGYTKKQWGVEPRELPASILKRLPVRFDYNDIYYNSRWQGIPEEGYTALVERMADHPKVTVKTSAPFEPSMVDAFEHTFFTGPLDAFFAHDEGRLRYRTVFWERQEEQGDFQGNAVINYPEMAEAFTRIHEHKHFAPWESHARTLLFTEYSKATEPPDTPYYPLRLGRDKDLLARYTARAQALENVSFLGRLGTYRYLNMDKVIAEALLFAKEFCGAVEARQPPPVFGSGIVAP